ncbi:copper resistance protein NlpE [Desulfuromonas sp. AOP6]|uniref:copper resistance protein NlpE n=1 Tax=Desulfuromonas sp. AOP6 TaxID=1566351 RepID=UPI00127D4870|nr:copper resistance protein NlpE [Desulfuromonas sp. AOP6]BCA78544.1 copper resistance protein [Desulfuromonas sp. AOP6]
MTRQLAGVLLVALALMSTNCTYRASISAGYPVMDEHNSRNSLDWPGTYAGVLPCADCAGLETTLTIRSDSSYHLETRPLGKSDRLFEEQGTFTWLEGGSIIQLNDGATRYLVGENRLFLLDRRGRRITGDLAAHYILHKE